MNHIDLSKEISYALRHAPHEYGLELNHEGWVDVGQLINGLKKKEEYEKILVQDIIDMIEFSQKKRHEYLDGKIRALYGHSIQKHIDRIAEKPPVVLFHGTARRFIDSIMKEGILSQERQYVHLSENVETATSVGKRHDAIPVILKVDSEKAHSDGILFYHAGNKIWLAESIDIHYLKVMQDINS